MRKKLKTFNIAKYSPTYAQVNHQMINVGKKLVAHNIQGFISGQAIFFLLNFNLAERQIWITRHGMQI
jgi:hypothetical protein